MHQIEVDAILEPPAVAHAAVTTPYRIGYERGKCQRKGYSSELGTWATMPSTSPFSADVEMVQDGKMLYIRSKKGRLSSRDKRLFWRMNR